MFDIDNQKEYKISYDVIKEYKLEQNRKKKRAYYISKKNIA